jgi:hypothetical protein
VGVVVFAAASEQAAMNEARFKAVHNRVHPIGRMGELGKAVADDDERSQTAMGTTNNLRGI